MVRNAHVSHPWRERQQGDGTAPGTVGLDLRKTVTTWLREEKLAGSDVSDLILHHARKGTTAVLARWRGRYAPLYRFGQIMSRASLGELARMKQRTWCSSGAEGRATKCACHSRYEVVNDLGKRCRGLSTT